MNEFAQKHNLNQQEVCAFAVIAERGPIFIGGDAGEHLASVARECAAEAFGNTRIHSAGGLVAVSRYTSNHAESITDIIARKEMENTK